MVQDVDTTAQILLAAAAKCRLAEEACRAWEMGADPEVVTGLSAAVVVAAEAALEAVVTDEPWDRELIEPEGRRGRLAYAGWLVLLAATDEHGTSADFANAARLFGQAALA